MLTKFLRWINLTLILITILAYLSPFVSPESFWLLSVAGLSFPWLVILHIFFIIYWLSKKDRYLFFSFACLILGWGHVQSFYGFGGNKDVVNQEQIRVMSYNAHYLKPLFSMHVGDEAFENKKDFSKFMKKMGTIQILCAQEANQGSLEFFRDSFQLPYYFNSKENSKRTFIFSKYPLLKTGNIKFDNTWNSCIWADLKVQDQIIRVYNVHLQSNKISDTAEKISEEGNIQEKETWESIGDMFTNYKEASKKRARQAERVAKHIAACPYPVILGGDFNDTPLSYTYHVLSTGFQDTFKECGSGIGTTYGGSIPALRIDYVLADENFEVLGHQTFKKNYSDHFPVVGTLRFRE